MSPRPSDPESGAPAPAAAPATVSASPVGARLRRVPVDGVLLLDKPQGLTSTAALARAKRALNAEKAGHTGTLDPLASGLLPLCFGEATKFAADLLEADKSYEATLQLGVTTTTGDAEGEVVEVRPAEFDADAFPATLEAVLARFRGEIEQVPPMYSALKRDGKPLYEYARAGVTLERAPRRVTIGRLDLVEIAAGTAGLQLTISVDCSKGTYIRSLAEDIGAALGCGAHLTALRRTRVGALDLAQAVPLRAFEAALEAERAKYLLPVDALLASLPRIELDDTAGARFAQGQRLAMNDSAAARNNLAFGPVRVYRAASGGAAILLGTAELRADSVLAPTRLVNFRTPP